MKRFAITTAALAVLAAAPAAAQDAGATIMGNDDAAVGTVLSNDGTTVIVDTGTHQVPLGPEAFAEREGVWTLNTTKAELDTTFGEMMAQQQAALQAALVVGAEVVTADAQLVGPITEINEQAVVVEHGGQPVGLPHEMFALDAEGKLMILADMESLMQAMAAAG